MATLYPTRVFVLGAGFTKAFYPSAPLMTDDYDGDSLLAKFREFPHAKGVLESEFSETSNRQIDVERLMTRLEGGMPYDLNLGADPELRLLLSEVKRGFRTRLEETRKQSSHHQELKDFARYCLCNHVNCITFNYDDVLDEAICGDRANHNTPEPWWYPTSGYGFFCKPSAHVVRNDTLALGQTSLLLLKLHGSINWYPLRGSPQPYTVDAILHNQEWAKEPVQNRRPDLDTVIKDHLEQEPFIVPPVLTKSAIVDQPILRLVWYRAYQLLKEAEEVTFVGYSFPVTDIAARFLFRETLSESAISNLKVVNYPSDENGKELIRYSYKSVFREMSDTQFDFRDALDWSKDLVSGRGQKASQ